MREAVTARRVWLSGVQFAGFPDAGHPILANELHTPHPNPRSALSVKPMFQAGLGIKDPGGKAFSNTSIGEVGEKAFPAGSVGSKEQRKTTPTGAAINPGY